MSNAPESASPTTETQATETPTVEPRGMTAEEFNRASTAREKAFQSKIEKLFQAQLAALQPAQPEPESTPAAKPTDEHAKQIQALTKQVQRLESERKAAVEKAQQVELRTSIQAALSGKVMPDWMDIAIEQVARGFAPDDTLEDAVQTFLGDAKNKRFLPAPKTPTQKQISGSGQLAQGSNGIAGISEIDRAAAIAALINS